jgi:hypothetical protein
MGTTVTPDPDSVTALRPAVRAGLSARRQAGTPSRTPSGSLGLRHGVNIDKVLQLSADLEDAEIVRKLELRK